MNIKDKYMTDMNREKLDSEFKADLVRAMQQKFESDDEDDYSVVFDENENFTDFDFTADSDPDIRPDIIHSESKKSITILKYIASSAAVLAIASSSVLFLKSILPEHSLTQEAMLTTAAVTASPESGTPEVSAAVTTAAVSETGITEAEGSASVTSQITEASVTQEITSSADEKNKVTQPAPTAAPASSGSQADSEKPAHSEIVTKPQAPATSELEDTKKEYLSFFVEKVEDKGDGYFDVYFGCNSSLTLSSFVFYPEYDSGLFEFVSAEKCIKDRYFTGNTMIDQNVVMFFDSSLKNHEFSGKTLVRYTLRAKDGITDGSYKIGFTVEEEQAASANHLEDDTIIAVNFGDTLFTPGYINVTGSELWKKETATEEHDFTAKLTSPEYHDDGSFSVYLDCESDCTINEFLLNIIYDHQNLTLINSEITADDKYRKNLFTDSSRIFFSSAESDSEAFTGGIIARFDFRPADNSEDESAEINIVMETNIFGTDNRDISIVIPADKAVLGGTKAELR